MSMRIKVRIAKSHRSLRCLGDSVPKVVYELILNLRFFDGLLASDEEQSQLIMIGLVDVNHQLFKGS